MRPSWFRGALVAVLLAGVATPAPAADRLERFRAVARERLAVAADGADRDRAIAELYEVVDAEVLDSLRGEEPFSSLVFIRERLDAMMESWGGAILRVLRIPGAGSRVPLTLGLYSLTGVEGSGSLRVYAGTGAGRGPRRLLHAGRPPRRAGVAAGSGSRGARVRGVERPARGPRRSARCTRSCGKGATTIGWRARGPPPPSGPTACG